MPAWCLPVDSSNGTSEFNSGDLVSAVTRVMVSQNRLYSDSDEVVALQVFSEVIELDGKEVNSSFYLIYAGWSQLIGSQMRLRRFPLVMLRSL